MPPPVEYVALINSRRNAVTVDAAFDLVDPKQSIDLTVVLRRTTSVAGARLATQRSHQSEQIGADSVDIASVVSFAVDTGLTVDRVNANARVVCLSGSAKNVEAAFKTQLRVSKSGYRTWTDQLYIPKWLDGKIETVVGLDDHPVARPHLHIRPESGAGQGEVFSPIEIAGLYQFPTAFKGRGQRIAILEFGGGYRPQDLQSYFSKFGETPNISSVFVDGAKNSPHNHSRATFEVYLDLDIIGSLVPEAAIIVFFSNNSEKGFIDAFAEAVYGEFRPTIISVSWGGSEKDWQAQTKTAINSILQDTAALDISVCISTGDAGSSDGDGGMNVQFPASSPYALACGGTSITVANGVLAREIVWNDKTGATGGGVSSTFAVPSWQSTVNVPPTSAKKAFYGRGIPDVAGDADEYSGYAIEAYGTNYAAGGTSAVSPLWASLIAMINQYLDSDALGFINPFLYYQTDMRASCRDITQGNNGAYSAAVGWDPCTGWGSPNGLRLLTTVASWYFVQLQINYL